MTVAIFEIVFEVLVEAIWVMLNATLGLALAMLTYWLWVQVRRRVWGLDRTVVAETPSGDRFRLEVPGLRMRTPISNRVFGVGAGSAQRPDVEPSRHDRLHPDNVTERAGMALVVVVPFLLMGVVALALIFIVELILAAVFFALASIVASAIRHRWTCVVTDPDGRQSHHRTRGLRAAGRLRDKLTTSIRRGDLDALEASRRQSQQ